MRLHALLLLCIACFWGAVTAFEQGTVERGQNKRKKKGKTKTKRKKSPKVKEGDDEDLLEENDGNTFLEFTLQHSLAPHKWSDRGQVSLKFLHNSAKLASLQFSSVDFAPFADEFNKLVDSNQPYRLRLVSKGGQQQQQPMASIRACALQESGFRERLTFHVDVYGHVIAMDYKTPLNECAEALQPLSSDKEIPVRSKGKVTMGKPGERPRLPSMETIVAAKKKAEAGPEPGFFAKYWKYMLPIAIMMMMRGGDAGGGGKPAAKK